MGAGVGGLAAALALARKGCDVTILEARDGIGGLASCEAHDGLRFDAGPYVLLDRPSLEQAFARLGLSLDGLGLRRVDHLLSIERDGGSPVHLHASVDRTASQLAGGDAWERFVEEMTVRHARLAPCLLDASPSVASLLRRGAWRDVPFLLGSLHAVLRRHPLSDDARLLVEIWTRIAGQRVDEAPAPMALVPALVHGPGAWLPSDGIGAIADAVGSACRAAGVAIRTGVRVTSIETNPTRVLTDRDEVIACDAVVSNATALGTLGLLARVPKSLASRVASWPLQSPGACIGLAVRDAAPGAMLRFRLTRERVSGCRVLALPALVHPHLERDGWSPARLIAPLDHDVARRAGPLGQAEFAQHLLDEPWWREHVGETRVLFVRTPSRWGSDFHLADDAMNPVMTARMLRAGRLPHRLPGVPGVHACGASTHPGQWVSNCLLSGLHAASGVLAHLRD